MAQPSPSPQVVSFSQPLLSPPLLSARSSDSKYNTPMTPSFVQQPSFTGQPPSAVSEQGATKQWRPLILTPWILVALCVTMFLGAIGLEVAYSVTKKRNGWSLPPNHKDYLHYADTWIPVLIVMGLVSAFTAADYFLMKMVPFVELRSAHGAKGDTLLLDYTGEPKYLVWIMQLNNRHYLAAVSTIICLLLLGLQPLASSLIQIRPTEYVRDPIGVPKFGTVGLNANAATLEGFASAAGFAETDSRYKIGRPPFVWQEWAVDEFQRPTSFISNGTMQANTTGIEQEPNCVKAANVNLAQSGTNLRLTGSWNGCPVSLDIDDQDEDVVFGVDAVANCTSADINNLPAPVRPVFFWVVSKKTTYASGGAPAALVFCTPKLSVHDVTVTVNLATGELINVMHIEGDGEHATFGTGPPLNGQTWNGVQHDLTGADADTQLRAEITRLQLSQSVAVLLQKEKDGLETVLANTDKVVEVVSNRYALYLALSARSNYFVTDQSGSNVLVQITEIQERLWLTTLSTHLMTVILLIASTLGGVLHYLHFKKRQNMKLFAPPSMAVAAAITKDSPVHNLLHSNMDERMLRASLGPRRLGADDTGRIVLLPDRNGDLEKPAENVPSMDYNRPPHTA